MMQWIASRIGDWVGLALPVLGGISLLAWWIVGWACLLSPRLRAAVRADWRGRSRIGTIVAAGLGLVFFAILNGAALLVAFVAVSQVLRS
jgi:hypothetical protein